jgi:hypothetical protein
MRTRFGWLLSAAAGTLALTLLQPLSAHAQIPSGNVFYACVQLDKDADTGKLARLVAANEACKKNEARVQWNAQGPMGPVGLPGAQGPAGPQGAQGAAGVQGPAGPAGPTGAQGPVGAMGPQGPIGAIGPQGSVGATGAAGAQGPKGDPGTGVTVQDVATGTACGAVAGSKVTVGLGNTSIVCDGQTGPAGPQGPIGPAGSAAVFPLGPATLTGIIDPALTHFPPSTATSDCGDGQVAVGLRLGTLGATNPLLSSGLPDVKIRCALITAQTSFLGVHGVVGPVSEGRAIGSVVTSVVADCPAGFVMTGFYGFEGGVSVDGTPAQMAIGAQCAAFGSGGSVRANSDTVGVVGDSLFTFSLSCPLGKVVTGLANTSFGRTTKDSLRLRCQ